MKYKQAINRPDGAKWCAEIDNEHDHMVKNKVSEAVKRKSLPHGTKVTDSTWAHKKKSYGTLSSRLNAGGFKKRDGQHYDGSSINAPVTNLVMIRIIVSLMLMAGMTLAVVDINGAFLHGDI